MIAGMGITAERENSFDFSDPYFEGGSMFAVDAESDIQTLEDLSGHNVAVKIGTTGEMIANEVLALDVEELTADDADARLWSINGEDCKLLLTLAQ